MVVVGEGGVRMGWDGMVCVRVVCRWYVMWYKRKIIIITIIITIIRINRTQGKKGFISSFSLVVGSAGAGAGAFLSGLRRNG